MQINPEKSAALYLARFGGQTCDGVRITNARARAKSEAAWARLQCLYAAWDDARWQNSVRYRT